MKEVFTRSTPINFPKFEQQLETIMPELPRLEARIAQYMKLNLTDLSFETGVSISRKVGVSEVTVSRLLHRLGYRGMRGLKQALREELSDLEMIQVDDKDARMMSDEMTQNMDFEYKAMREIYHQTTSPIWNELVSSVAKSDEVYITGFQAVRGMAEDCARRLHVIRNNIQFVSAHDGMLAEWLNKGDQKRERRTRCLILIDVVPYAREATILSKLCRRENHALIVFTDEMCHWAKNYTEMVIYASTRTGLTLESTVAIGVALNLMVNAVAEQYSTTLPHRLDQWKSYTRELKLF